MEINNNFLLITIIELLLISHSSGQTECQDKLPQTCNFSSELNTCSKIVAFGKRNGYSTEDVCNAPWDMIDDEIDEISCAPNTVGSFQDTCKVSCNQECEEEQCRDIVPERKCNRWKSRGKCGKNWAKTKCQKTCDECTDDEVEPTAMPTTKKPPTKPTTESPKPSTAEPTTPPPVTSPPDLTNNPDGTGGTPPSINVYLGVQGEPGTKGVPGDAHPVHGLMTKDGAGYIVCGKGNELGEEGGGSSIDGFVLRINQCNAQSDYGQHYLGVRLQNKGNNCRRNYKWVTRIGAINQYDFTSWVAESPDGSYIIAVGTTNVGIANKRYLSRMITKIDSSSGRKIWSARLPTTDNLGGSRNSGYESVVFTSDGGFIASGFSNYPSISSATVGPMFKSAGQVEEGYPLIEKFPASIANANSVNENDFVVGRNIEWRYVNQQARGSESGSAKALRSFMDGNMERVVSVYGTRAAVVVLDVADGSVFKKRALDDSLGQIGDVEVITDKGTNSLKGFAIAGHSYNLIRAGNDGCTSDCKDIRGQIHKLDKNLNLKKSTFFDGYEGGLYQYRGISKGYKSLIHTECWGIAKSLNDAGDHDGFLIGCGNGIEGCPSRGYTAEAKRWCQRDPRRSWRSLVVKTNLDADIEWYRQDNYWNGEENPGTSASEYVISGNGRIVSVNDELFGIGIEVLQ